MRLLHYVGPGEDRDHLLVETAEGDERFSLSLDEQLRSTLRVEPPAPAPVPTSADSTLSPREIQVRVRAGADPRTVADEAGTTLERVMRFAGPVLSERARMADEARRARARRSGAVAGEAAVVVFGEAVDARFTAHGIDPVTVTWDSLRRDDGQWIVSAVWTGGEHERRCEWVFSLANRAVSPLDDTASDLLSDRPIRPFAPAPASDPEPEPAGPTGPAAGALGALGALSRLPAPAAPDGDTGPLPRVGRRPRPVVSLAPPAGQAPEQAWHHALDDGDVTPQQIEPATEPPLPLPLADLFGGTEPAAAPPPAHRTEDDDARAARARIPSWDDILMGVRRKHD